MGLLARCSGLTCHARLGGGLLPGLLVRECQTEARRHCLFLWTPIAKYRQVSPECSCAHGEPAVCFCHGCPFVLVRLYPRCAYQVQRIGLEVVGVLRQWVFLRGVAARLVMHGLAGFAAGTARVRVSHRRRAASSVSLDAESQVSPECSCALGEPAVCFCHGCSFVLVCLSVVRYRG